jgi:hypothetical protein
MKKTFLFRLFALTFFCLASLAIRSEISSSCSMQCTYAAQKAAVTRSAILNEAHDPIHHDDGFFIKL